MCSLFTQNKIKGSAGFLALFYCCHDEWVETREIANKEGLSLP